MSAVGKPAHEGAGSSRQRTQLCTPCEQSEMVNVLAYSCAGQRQRAGAVQPRQVVRAGRSASKNGSALRSGLEYAGPDVI